MSGVFISGTDTDVGKTVVCSWLMAHSNAQYWKPIQSGLLDETDLAKVKRLSGAPANRFSPETYRLQQPLSPHASAKIDGVTVEIETLVSRFKELKNEFTTPLIVEGAGGLLVPMNDDDLIVDLAFHLQLPVILVARSGLGTINHTLLSLEALHKRAVPVAGVIMNGPPNPSNVDAVTRYGRTKVLAELDIVKPLSNKTLMDLPLPEELAEVLQTPDRAGI